MDAYKAYLEEQGLAVTTIKNHIRNLTKYGESFGLNANQDTTLANLLTYADTSRPRSCKCFFKNIQKTPYQLPVLFFFFL